MGVNDGIHNAEGKAKILTLKDGSQIIRLEDFRSTMVLMFISICLLINKQMTL